MKQLSPDERQVLTLVDRLARPDGAIGPGMGDRVLATSDLSALVHSTAPQNPDGTGDAAALKDFDRVYASKGASTTYDAMRLAYLAQNGRHRKLDTKDEHLSAILQSLFAYVDLFSKPRKLSIGPLATATLVGVNVAGDTATLTYHGDKTGRELQVILDLTRTPAGAIHIGGVHELQQFSEFVPSSQ